jgi:hypothetical protein
VSQDTSNHSFDELARGLANGSITRGKAIRLMGAALVGSALASLPGVALADDDDCRGFGRRCRRDRQCCSKNCVRRGEEKVCVCPEGKSRCGGRCVTNCTGGATLNPQTCQCVCPTVACEGGIVNSTTCECECAPPKTLVNGQCVCPTINCGAVGTLNPNTCACECDLAFPDLCENNTDPNLQGCCPTLMGTSCVPLGTVCSPPT